MAVPVPATVTNREEGVTVDDALELLKFPLVRIFLCEIYPRFQDKVTKTLTILA